MPYQVDVWSGDLHTDHVASNCFEDWSDVASFMNPLIDAGLLCNVLHSDFKAPPERVKEIEQQLLAGLQGGRPEFSERKDT